MAGDMKGMAAMALVWNRVENNADRPPLGVGTEIVPLVRNGSMIGTEMMMIGDVVMAEREAEQTPAVI